MTDKNDSGFVEAGNAGPSHRSGVSQSTIGWLLAAISAGLGFIATACCGIPFVPPMSTLAIVLGTMGCLAAVAVVVMAFLRGRTTKVAFMVVGGALFALNSFAIFLGRLGKHLIDYLEGH